MKVWLRRAWKAAWHKAGPARLKTLGWEPARVWPPEIRVGGASPSQELPRQALPEHRAKSTGASPLFAKPEMGSVRYRVRKIRRRPWPSAARVPPASIPARTPRGARTPTMTGCRIAGPSLSSPPALTRRTPTKGSALRLRGGRCTPLVADAPSLSCAPPMITELGLGYQIRQGLFITKGGMTKGEGRQTLLALTTQGTRRQLGRQGQRTATTDVPEHTDRWVKPPRDPIHHPRSHRIPLKVLLLFHGNLENSKVHLGGKDVPLFLKPDQ